MKVKICAFLLVLYSLLLIACETETVYHHFEPTQIAGWERNDTLKFSVPAMAVDGDYREKLILRVNNDYPFMGLTLIVEQTVFPGNGFYEYDYPLTQLALHAGDSLQISVRHNMKREILPGIADVGIEIKRK